MIKNYFIYCTILFVAMLLLNKLKSLIHYRKFKKYKSFVTIDEKVITYTKLLIYCFIPLLNVFLIVSTLTVFLTSADDIIKDQIEKGEIYKLWLKKLFFK